MHTLRQVREDIHCRGLEQKRTRCLISAAKWIPLKEGATSKLGKICRSAGVDPMEYTDWPTTYRQTRKNLWEVLEIMMKHWTVVQVVCEVVPPYEIILWSGADDSV